MGNVVIPSSWKATRRKRIATGPNLILDKHASPTALLKLAEDMQELMPGKAVLLRTLGGRSVREYWRRQLI